MCNKALPIPMVAALGEDGWAAFAVDEAIDPSTAQQRGVGGVDDRVDVLDGDVSLDEHDVRHVLWHGDIVGCHASWMTEILPRP